ncbi:MAG: metallophosphoesterase [Lentisphaerales bacterium]|nr:metallophosphoesterase [Lentisphaerales bacterium]
MSKTDLQKKSRTILVGDIHGCFDELQLLLEKVKYSKKSDRLISLGDLVHKGPKSHKVIDYFIKNDLEVIMGNHDWHLQQALKGEIEMYPVAEGFINKSEYSHDEICQWLEKLPFYIDDEDFLAVHGALNPTIESFEKTKPHQMINGRYFDPVKGKIHSKLKDGCPDRLIPWYKGYEAPPTDKPIIFGHWAQKGLIQYKNFHGLDTGCCYGGYLSCLLFPKKNIVQVRSLQPKMFDY